MKRITIAITLFLLASVGDRGVVHAQTAPNAFALAKEAAKAFRSGDIKTALEKYTEANRLRPNPILDINIGQCLERLGRPDQALIHCKIALNARDVSKSVKEAARECVQRVSKRLSPPRLDVTSEPIGARVLIDGSVEGQTPWTGHVPPGRRQIDIEMDGYRTFTDFVAARIADQHKVRGILVPTEVGALLTITSNPSGAEVSLNGDEAGQTPLQRYPVDARSYAVGVKVDGYIPQVLTVSMSDGSHLEQHFDLMPKTSEASFNRRKKAGWALVAVGTTSFLTGIYFGVKALDTRQKADRIARTQRTAAQRSRYESLVVDMDQSKLLADVFMSLGVLSGGGGAVLLTW